jgi:hypothetical protein
MPRIQVVPVHRYFTWGSSYSAARQRHRFHGMQRESSFNKIRFDVWPMRPLPWSGLQVAVLIIRSQPWPPLMNGSCLPFCSS